MTAKKITKKRDARAKLFCWRKPIGFCRSRRRRRRRLLNFLNYEEAGYWTKMIHFLSLKESKLSVNARVIGGVLGVATFKISG